ncbi:MAG: phosphatase PAP2 family protein [Paracoccaceae bacterium]
MRISTSLTSAALALALLTTAPAAAQDRGNFEQAGDIAQIALPLLAGFCAIRQHRSVEFFAGLATQAALTQALKLGLGEIPMNTRPNGGKHGFPSGHTAAAFYGATNLAKKCFPDRPVLGGLAYGTALAVGMSRVNANKHNNLQVGVGAVIGYYANGVTFSASKDNFGFGFSIDF